ncbi:sensor domain-containing protein [Alicyclobacillus fastidiosus]|uniref:Diguanylate cyclase n=1 Tax=Alicyclobacillus fastidiosus TaxID=392011 RepID=A0ABV5A928_9BACL|nr:diguanylate cyclase [Alicyclobacillus fastidiosus]WEH10656.1 diguanylate cyclase [Alicyclobacillus fastidiosus]
MRRKHELLAQPGMFQYFFDNHPDGICIVDSEGYVLDANQSALHISGYAYDEIVEKAMNELLGYVGDAQTRPDLNFSEPTELYFRHRMGHMVYVRVASIPVVVDGRKMGMFIEFEDITEQREQRQELLDIQEMFSFIAEKSQNIISAFSPNGVFTYISPTVKALLGYTPEEVIGKPAAAFNHPDDNEELRKFHNLRSSGQSLDRFTGRVRHKNGEYRWYETTAQYIRNESGQIIQTIGVGRDITDRKQAEETIAYLAYHDTLTDLPNRRLFMKRARFALEESQQGRHSLMLLDLDGFKYVNDTFGHDIGDQLLIEVAKRLTDVIGDNDIVARLGGDEFTILQTHIEQMDDWTRFIERIKDVIAEPISIEGHILRVNASIGVALYPSDGTEVETLMRNADVAMYRSKKGKTQL